MKGCFAALLMTLLSGCAGPARHATTLPESKSVHLAALLDGRTVTFEGRWNGLSKAESQIVCDTEPKVIDVRNIGDRITPQQDRRIRVTATLHWHEMTEEAKRWVAEQMAQGAPPGYSIEWPDARWTGVGNTVPAASQDRSQQD